MIVVEKKGKVLVIDTPVPGNSKMESKEKEKVEKYQELRQEIISLWQMKEVEVIPVVVGALGAMSTRIDK